MIGAGYCALCVVNKSSAILEWYANGGDIMQTSRGEMVLSWNGNTVEWYATFARPDYADARYQMNKNGATYDYLAFG